MKPLTPYLKSLKAFESTARLGSFSEAGKELFVTSAAVGQLVKQLETQLGTPLFHRSQSGKTRLALTEPAKQALPDIQAGFARLEKGLAQLQQANNPCALTLTTSPAFAAKWLLPRLEQFQTAHPDIAVRLHTDLQLLDFAAHDIDAGIRYGKGSWANLHSEKLLDEEIFPVCSPNWLARHPTSEPFELLNATLIHDVSLDSQSGFMSWQQWFEDAGVPVFLLKQGLQINNSAAVLQAAIDGQGVALARSVMAKDDAASGRLVRLFPDIKSVSPLSYFLVYPKEYGNRQKIKLFQEWLLGVAQK
ncbi:transcriptional regulator GcvA [Neisseria animalis]|uniref:Transcriptional regulator GcvA n=1 Tax=Neisseria animalis TaxID=492 RepID=A0A5P3MSG1_NEIAN|nr:transcriptional regulator GcvA [Neisseria animalis]QEY24035.1 transcriptional regulator GcvA [Neisseria animalis]ROW32603.1 transcriptional regulator GcvA [Neisseria animalis]VEE06128.1 LysR family transcriptional regulator [Neisseria animalis]